MLTRILLLIQSLQRISMTICGIPTSNGKTTPGCAEIPTEIPKVSSRLLWVLKNEYLKTPAEILSASTPFGSDRNWLWTRELENANLKFRTKAHRQKFRWVFHELLLQYQHNFRNTDKNPNEIPWNINGIL